MVKLSKTYTFLAIYEYLTNDISETFGQTDEQTNRSHKHLWAIMESVLKKRKKNKVRKENWKNLHINFITKYFSTFVFISILEIYMFY